MRFETTKYIIDFIQNKDLLRKLNTFLNEKWRALFMLHGTTSFWKEFGACQRLVDPAETLPIITEDFLIY